jgi:hypothetical protein
VLENSFGISILRATYAPHVVEEKLFDPGCKVAPIDWRQKGAVAPV